MHIAKLYLYQLKDPQSAEIWLRKLHRKGDNPIHYEASSLLYTLALEAKKYKTATAILRNLVNQPIKGTEWYVPVNFKLAELYQIQEMWRKAVQYYGIVARTRQESQYRTQARKRLKEIQRYLKQVAAAKTAKNKIIAAKQTREARGKNDPEPSSRE